METDTDTHTTRAAVAQLAELPSRKGLVGSSILSGGSKIDGITVIKDEFMAGPTPFRMSADVWLVSPELYDALNLGSGGALTVMTTESTGISGCFPRFPKLPRFFRREMGWQCWPKLGRSSTGSTIGPHPIGLGSIPSDSTKGLK